ncbi:MAG: M24 family metallopeptidase, partial [Candidatus Bathyarchaeia archaeon]
DDNSSVSSKQLPYLSYILNPCVLLPRDGDPIIVGAKICEETYRRTTCIDDIRVYTVVADRTKLFKEALRDLKLTKKRIGIDLSAYPTITAIECAALKEAVPECKFVDSTEILRMLVYEKSENEIAYQRIAAEVQNRAYAKFLNSISLGDTETDVMKIMLQSQIDSGATEFGFTQINAHPIYLFLRPTNPNHAFKKRDFLLLDTGSTYRGYHSDFNRYFAFSEATPGLDNYVKKWAKFYDEALGFWQVGRPIVQIAQDVKRLFKKYKIQSPLGLEVFCGHNVGYNVFDEPVFGTWCKPGVKLQSNTVISIEYFVSSKWGPMLWEEDFVVRDDSLEKISTFPNELHIVR